MSQRARSLLPNLSSLKLHRDLGVSQPTAWNLAHRIRETWVDKASVERFAGPVEVDETCIGGKAKNMHAHKRAQLTGRGGVDIRDRATGRITATVVPSTDAPDLAPFVEGRTTPAAQVCTDGHSAYRALSRHHEVVKHSVGEYVRGMAHTNGIESHWALIKRGYHGTFHHVSAKHLDRYVGAMATKRRGRPAKRDMPEPIPDTPDNIARALLTSPPRDPDEWRYDTDRGPLARSMVTQPDNSQPFSSGFWPEQLDVEFQTLAHRWRRETMALSSTSDILDNAAFEQIVALGIVVLPYVLRELDAGDHWWLYALDSIVGEIEFEGIDSVDALASAWVAWGRDQHYIN